MNLFVFSAEISLPHRKFIKESGYYRVPMISLPYFDSKG